MSFSTSDPSPAALERASALRLKDGAALTRLRLKRHENGVRLEARVVGEQVTSPARVPQKLKIEGAAPLHAEGRVRLSLQAKVGPADEAAVEESVQHPKPDEGVTPNVVGKPSSSHGGAQRLSSPSLTLRKKLDSAVEGGRDLALEPVPSPACCNCRVAFTLDAEVKPLAPIVCPRCETRQVVPAQIGHFVLERELGRGGMGVTYRAFDLSLHRNVAIKLISESRAGNKDTIEGLVQEARRVATLSHPNIVPIYSIGSVEGMPYLVMELLSDGILSRPLHKGIPLSEMMVMETGLAVAKALAEAANHGILHLDVKPANILHDRFGVAKLIDFGLASHWNDDRSIGWGTGLYMAPERLRREGQDVRSDQYSLGLTLWHALAGKAPFEAPDQEKLVVTILTHTPRVITKHRPDLLDWTAGLIHKMVAHRPEDRYANYKELIWAFEFVLDHLRRANPQASTPSAAS